MVATVTINKKTKKDDDIFAVGSLVVSEDGWCVVMVVKADTDHGVALEINDCFRGVQIYRPYSDDPHSDDNGTVGCYLMANFKKFTGSVTLTEE